MFNQLHKNITATGAEISPLEYGLKAQHRSSLTVMENLENEVWKDVLGWEFGYQVSNLGRIKSKKRTILTLSKSIDIDEKILHQSNLEGYLRVVLRDEEGKYKHIKVHRIIALNFISNPNKYPVINHINGIKTDNNLSNLEWCTVAQNNKHASDMGLIKRKGADNCGAKPVIHLKTLTYFGCCKDASKHAGVTYCLFQATVKRKLLHRGYGYVDKLIEANLVSVEDVKKLELNYGK